MAGFEHSLHPLDVGRVPLILNGQDDTFGDLWIFSRSCARCWVPFDAARLYP